MTVATQPYRDTAAQQRRARKRIRRELGSIPNRPLKPRRRLVFVESDHPMTRGFHAKQR